VFDLNYVGFRGLSPRGECIATQFIEPGSERFVDRGKQVAVAIERDGDRGVAEPFL
jgi:hypothetical protein